MENWREWFDWFTLGDWAESGIRWLISTLGFLLDFLRDLLLELYSGLNRILSLPSWWLVVLAGGLLGWLAAEELRRRQRRGRARDRAAGPIDDAGPGPAETGAGRLGRAPGWLVGLSIAAGLWAVDLVLWVAHRSGDLALLETYGGQYALLDSYRPSFLLLFLPPSWTMILMLGALAWLARGWLFGLGAVVSLLLIDVMNQWGNAMQTLSMVIVAVGAATLLAIPIGILAARSRVVSGIVRPALDFMQTMPALIYVLIAVFMFSVGVVPGIVATLIFAMPPGIRLTELGIRQVDAEVVEAGQAFGSPPGAILRQIQIPLALPTIMAGVNQVIMLSLSMVVLAGFVGAPGLGQQVITAISRTNLSLGVEAGLSVVILAIYLDRVTAAFGARSTVARLERVA